LKEKEKNNKRGIESLLITLLFDVC
jgi:hypothetical protein